MGNRMLDSDCHLSILETMARITIADFEELGFLPFYHGKGEDVLLPKGKFRAMVYHPRIAGLYASFDWYVMDGRFIHPDRIRVVIVDRMRQQDRAKSGKDLAVGD